jgi:hypothetical protein
MATSPGLPRVQRGEQKAHVQISCLLVVEIGHL